MVGVWIRRQEVVLCINPPITVGFSGWIVKLFHRAPLIYNVQDVWPDCLIAIDQLRSRLLIQIFKWLERFIYARSKKVVVLSEGMKANLLGKGVPAEKIEIIQNWANIEHIVPVEKENDFTREYRLEGFFIVLFAGNLGYIAVLGQIIEAAERLKDSPGILFLIVGEGNAKPGLVEQVSKRKLTNVRFLPTQPKETLSQVLGSADIALVTLKKGLGQLNVPSKTYSIMAGARPVLAAVPKDSEIHRLILDADCGCCVPPEDPQALAEAILDLKNQPEQLKHYGRNGRQYVVEHYSRQSQIGKYYDLLHKAI